MNQSKSEQARRLKDQDPSRSNKSIARELGITGATVAQALKAKGEAPAVPSDNKPLAVFDQDGEKAIATVMIPGLKTLDDLIRYMKVDLGVWDVERHVINKWECASKHPKSGEVTVTPLFQIKAWLVRKAPEVRGLESLIKRLEAAAPILPNIKRPAALRLSPKRTLEVCIMDPHIGMLCSYPEADGPWDMDLAAGTIMQAIEDLLIRTKPYGPFCEIVMPFGNDFTHVDTIWHETTAGTPQPEAIDWHRVYEFAEGVAIKMVERLRKEAPVCVYEIPGNHSEMTDFTMARILKAWFRNCPDVKVDASSSPYKFHRAGCNLIGFEHGHHVKPIRMAGLMANERRQDWAQTEYREWHCGDQHRKGTPNIAFEEQGVSVEFIPGLTAPNKWHRQKSFSHQKRGAMAYVWDHEAGPICRVQFNISQYTHQALSRN